MVSCFLFSFLPNSSLCSVWQVLESISVADREQQLVLARSEYQHVLSSHEHTKQQFDGEGGRGRGWLSRVRCI